MWVFSIVCLAQPSAMLSHQSPESSERAECWAGCLAPTVFLARLMYEQVAIGKVMSAVPYMSGFIFRFAVFYLHIRHLRGPFQFGHPNKCSVTRLLKRCYFSYVFLRFSIFLFWSNTDNFLQTSFKTLSIPIKSYYC